MRGDVKKLIRRNFFQLAFVFFCFFLMMVIANLFIGNILSGQLSKGVEGILGTAEANIKENLAEVELTLLDAETGIQKLLSNGATQEELQNYLIATTALMKARKNKAETIRFFGSYGYIRGKFVDGVDFNPPSDYRPEDRPWYRTAIQSGNSIAYTAPYTEYTTGEYRVSAVKRIKSDDGTIGVLSIDLEFAWLNNYIASLRLTPGGYGMLLSDDMSILACPDNQFLGCYLWDLSKPYQKLSRQLSVTRRLYSGPLKNLDGTRDVVFFNRIFNGWYLGLITPYYEFYRELYRAVILLSVLAFIFALTLSVILIRLNLGKMRSEEENKRKSSFLADMSHEIRTPMNAIIGMSELVLREELTPRARKYVKNINQAGSNLLTIINEILDISKIESGKFSIVLVEYSLARLLNDCIGVIAPRLAEKPIRFFTHVNGPLPNLFIGDEVRIRQILLNLLTNAVKYTHEGSITLTISTITASTEESHQKVETSATLYIAVSDTGIGIKPEDLGKIFGNFVQVDMLKNRGIEGSGLGLAISRNLCRLMGGDVTATSIYGTGSTFLVTLPQSVKDPQLVDISGQLIDLGGQCCGGQSDADDADNHGLKLRFIAPKAQVLLVDDHQVNLMVAEGILEAYKIHVDSCLSGKDAIILIQQNTYDMVFMDHLMPEMDGIETVAIIRRLEHVRKMPIIALTANALTGMREMFLQRGFDDYLAKPIEIAKFDAILERWIPKDKQEAIQEPLPKQPQAGVSDGSFRIEGIDVKHGISMTGGAEAAYRQVLALYQKDARERLSVLEAFSARVAEAGTQPAAPSAAGAVGMANSAQNAVAAAAALKAQDFLDFTTQVHALKSASASIGAIALSVEAALLEAAGKSRDTADIQKRLPDFCRHLGDTADAIQQSLLEAAQEADQAEKAAAGDGAQFKALLPDLKKALEAEDIKAIDRILAELEAMSPGKEARGVLAAISDMVLLAEYGEAQALIESLL